VLSVPEGVALDEPEEGFEDVVERVVGIGPVGGCEIAVGVAVNC
jgi:hypothetical protein